MGGIRRREFITLVGGAAATWPLAARAQRPLPIIGFLVSGAADSFAIFVDAFKQGMHDNGIVEDRDYVLDLRFADGDYSRFPRLAAEVVQRGPAAIIVTTISAARAAQQATATIPIVMTGLIDPVGQGLIASLARPGGNTTGLANLAQDVMPKLVEILRATFPSIRVIAVLFNPANPANRGALLVGGGPFFNSNRERIVALAARHGLPASYGNREAALAGGLMSYASSQPDAYRQAGLYAGRILKGEKPGDLPVIRSTKFEFVLNLKTAGTLGLDVLPSLLAIADEVIE